MASYHFDILLYDPATEEWLSIKDKVVRAEVTFSQDSYCDQMTLELADHSLYAELDFTKLPAQERIEIKTRKDAGAWVSQGKFFVEQPDVLTDLNGVTIPSLWGRSTTARLGEPFARRISKVWTEDTMLSAVVSELVSAAGLPTEGIQIDIADFTIFANTLIAENEYPAEILARLAQTTNGYLCCKKDGSVWIPKHVFHPEVADRVVTDDVIEPGFTERPRFPEFGNRIKLSTETTSGLRVDLAADSQCLPANGTSETNIYALVTDAAGSPVPQGIVVEWETENDLVSLENEKSTTWPLTIWDEEVQADSFTQLMVRFPVSELIGIWAKADTGRQKNYATEATLDGRRITLAEALPYCDQHLVAAYRCLGVARNTVMAGPSSGNCYVYGSVGGMRNQLEFYLDNPCQCPIWIDLTPQPSFIDQGAQSRILITGEEDGGPVATGRRIYLSEPTGLGSLNWKLGRFGAAKLKNEKSKAINDIHGLTQAKTRHFIKSVSGVYLATDTGKSNNLYSSHGGKTITLSANVATDTDLVVDYTVEGAAIVTFTSADSSVGTARVQGVTPSRKEAGVSGDCIINIRNPLRLATDYPDEWYAGEMEEDDYSDGTGGMPESDLDLDTEYCDGQECSPEESCCLKGGVKGCWPWRECDSYGGGEGIAIGCIPKDMSEFQDFTDQKFNTARFGSVSSECTCEEICQAEFDVIGTTQNYDGRSGKSCEQLADEDCEVAGGCTDQEWNEAYESHKSEAISQCEEECAALEGDCCEESAISGSDTVDPGSSWKGTVSPACPAGRVEVTSNTGFDVGGSLNSTGTMITVTVAPDVCGSLTVKLYGPGDGCSVSDSISIRVNNAGQGGAWEDVSEAKACGSVDENGDFIEGAFELGYCPTGSPTDCCQKFLEGIYDYINGKFKYDQAQARACLKCVLCGDVWRECYNAEERIVQAQGPPGYTPPSYTPEPGQCEIQYEDYGWIITGCHFVEWKC